MNTSDTPETDKATIASGGDWSPVLRETSRRLERERDEAIRQLNETNESSVYSCNFYYEEKLAAERKRDEAIEKHRFAVIHWQIGVFKMQRERDEARAELADWKDSAKNVRKEFDDEHHCSCVPILRKLLKDAERERDEWAAMCGRYKQERDEARIDKPGE